MSIIGYEKLLNSISEGIIAVDNNMSITFFNSFAEEITGWQAKEAIGKQCFDILRNSHCKRNCTVKRSMDECLNCYLSRVLIKTKQGKPIPIKLSIMPLKNKEGKVIGAIKMISDQRELYPTNFEKFYKIGLIGSSEPMKEIFQLIETVSETNATVMILGKTGTGKEVVANAIHSLSTRKDKAFIKVNCTALSDTLLESELFGHEQGAFTGAVKKRKGRFELANKGTILLDEIGDISSQFQAKLLRIIQEGELERLGSSETIKVDVRIIVATNKNLEKRVKENHFRDDLFYRLNVFPITLPDLKDRKEDIRGLVDNFVNILNINYNKQKQNISSDAFEALLKYDFPGNIRELRNVIEHAYIKSTGNIIEKKHFPKYLLNKIDNDNNELNDVIQEKEVDHIKHVIEECNGNKSKAAKKLGISRKTLYNKLK